MSANQQNMYSIFDNKAGAYFAPFFAPTDGAAVRVVMDALEDKNTSLSRHPADYHLFHVGVWHGQTGEVQGLQAPRQLGILTDYLPTPRNDAPLFPGS